ncbi:MAG TPA: nucleotidyltransferase [Verrucomicrobiales bacterium]|jgi:predicted nucleotidyltransferase|nr:nucleotidyltransferase [Verrucomicrobiales bacterium]
MNELVSAAAALQSLMEQQQWNFCFIGGLVVQAWSEPRLTRDVDLTLLTGFGGEEKYIDTLLAHYTPRRSDARQFALMNRVLLLKNENGLGIDIALGALPFEVSAVRRARMVEAFPGVKLRFCSPEDLVVMKAFAGRDQDWTDVRMTIVRCGVQNLDWAYIREQLTPLAEAKEEPEIMERLEALRQRYTPA